MNGGAQRVTGHDLLVLAVAAVDRWTDYFTAAEGDGYRAWAASVPEGEVTAALAVAAHLCEAWLTAATERVPDAPLGAVAAAVARAVRGAVVNQLEVGGGSWAEPRYARLSDPDFDKGVAARLVFGFTNCDGQNHLAALLASRRVEPVELFAMEAGHRVVRLGADSILLDAWARHAPAFALTQAAAQRAGVPLCDHVPVVASGDGAPEGSDREGYAVLPTAEYERGHLIPILGPAGGGAARALAPGAPPRADREPLRTYLRARAHHLFGAPARALALYEAFLRGAPRPRTLAEEHARGAAAVFARRLREPA